MAAKLLAALTGFALLGPAFSADGSGRPAAPDFVFIVADDLGYADVGFNGSEEIPTPHLDRIADEGLRFTDGYVSFPVCGPSRAGFLTGRFQDRFGFTRNPTADPSNPDAGIPVDERMISEALASAGYQTMAVGKWHVGTHPSLRPLNRGFERFFGFLSGGHKYLPEELTVERIEDVKKRGDWYRTKLLDDDTPVEIDEYLTDELSHAAADFVADADDRPFFLYLAYNAPHTPMQATPKYLARFDHIEDRRRRTYAAMVSAMDDGVGEVLDSLDEAGRAENTLVVFLSDNGGAESNASSNSPLRAHKGTYFEGGIRVPFAVRWPARIAAGSVSRTPVSSLDLYATLVDVNDIAVPSDKPLDGRSLVSIFDDPTAEQPARDLFWRLAYRDPSYTIRRGSLKGIVDPEKGTMLFDLEADSAETTDLSRERPAAMRELGDAAKNWGADFPRDAAFPGRLSWPAEAD
ncbi:MAG: sulfatase-like hydrolase/transferase [Planctomycetota bacterium]